MNKMPDDYNQAIEWLKGKVATAHKNLLAYAEEEFIDLDINQLIEIRAVIGQLMNDYDLLEVDVGLLISHIVTVIGRENLLKKMEEHKPDD